MSSTTLDEMAAPNETKKRSAFSRLYRGETHFDFVGRRKLWFAISGIVILAGVLSLATRGLNFGIDFRGGTSWEVPANGASVSKVQNAMNAAGLSGGTVQTVGTGSNTQIQVQANLNGEPAAKQAATKQAVEVALARTVHIPVSQVNITDVGPTWGGEISKRAIIAVIVFFAVVVVYISLRFEWKMALAALIAVIHDLLVVVGVYSLTGLQVTSDTVIAVLTILGYSLYDTVVVFDRVAENTKGLGASGRMTYEDVVNLSMNQTLARSINTSLVAILPVLSVLVIGAQILGATTLQYFGLALVIGLLSGAYSSIFIASPVLSMMKEREARYVSIRQKLANRADRTGLLTPKAAAMMTASAQGVRRQATARGPAKAAGRGRAPQQGRRSGVLKPGAATASKRQPAVVQAGGTDGADGADAADDIDDDFDDELEAAGNGARNGAGVARGAGKVPTAKAAGAQSGRAKTGGGGARSGGSSGAGARPRPRKGKSSRKGRRR